MIVLPAYHNTNLLRVFSCIFLYHIRQIWPMSELRSETLPLLPTSLDCQVVLLLAALSKKTFWDSKIYGANMGSTWVLEAPDGPHVGPMNLAIGVSFIRVMLKQMISKPRGFPSPCSYWGTIYSGMLMTYRDINELQVYQNHKKQQCTKRGHSNVLYIGQYSRSHMGPFHNMRSPESLVSGHGWIITCIWLILTNVLTADGV